MGISPPTSPKQDSATTAGANDAFQTSVSISSLEMIESDELIGEPSILSGVRPKHRRSAWSVSQRILGLSFIQSLLRLCPRTAHSLADKMADDAAALSAERVHFLEERSSVFVCHQLELVFLL